MSLINKDKVISVLKQCFDPEIPIDLWNLGLIYDIKIDTHNIDIIMSLTTPGCTMGQFMADDIKLKLSTIPYVKEVNVDVVFDPPWEPEMMTDEGRKKLGFSPSKNEDKSKEQGWE